MSICSILPSIINKSILFKLIDPFFTLILRINFNILFNTKPKNKTLLISNHPSYFDIFTIIWWAKRHNRENDLCFIAKEDATKNFLIKRLFKDNILPLKRNITDDHENIIKFCNKLNNKDSYILVLFPEGTTYAQCTIKKSNEFIKKNNLNSYKNVICPRITGLDIINKNLDYDVLLDMTIIYNDYSTYYDNQKGIPFSDPKGFIQGHYPKKITLSIKDVSYIKYSTTIEKDVYNIWTEKDNYIEKYKSNFNGQYNIYKIFYNIFTDIYIWLCFSIIISGFYLL